MPPTITIYGDPDDSRDDATLRGLVERLAETGWHITGPPVGPAAVQRPNPGDVDRRPKVIVVVPPPGPHGPPGLVADFHATLPPRNPAPPHQPGGD